MLPIVISPSVTPGAVDGAAQGCGPLADGRSPSDDGPAASESFHDDERLVVGVGGMDQQVGGAINHRKKPLAGDAAEVNGLDARQVLDAIRSAQEQ